MLKQLIFKSSNDKEEIQISPEQIFEIPSTEISDIKIPTESSAIIIFKNSIVGRDKDGTPLIENFNPTDIKQYVVTKENFLTLPKLLCQILCCKRSYGWIYWGPTFLEITPCLL